jgi:hypothetical protein
MQVKRVRSNLLEKNSQENNILKFAQRTRTKNTQQ